MQVCKLRGGVLGYFGDSNSYEQGVQWLDSQGAFASDRAAVWLGLRDKVWWFMVNFDVSAARELHPLPVIMRAPAGWPCAREVHCPGN